MAKGTYIGSLPEDHPIFSRPLWIGSVMMSGQFAKSSQKNTDGETQETSQQTDTVDAKDSQA